MYLHVDDADEPVLPDSDRAELGDVRPGPIVGGRPSGLLPPSAAPGVRQQRRDGGGWQYDSAHDVGATAVIVSVVVLLLHKHHRHQQQQLLPNDLQRGSTRGLPHVFPLAGYRWDFHYQIWCFIFEVTFE